MLWVLKGDIEGLNWLWVGDELVETDGEAEPEDIFIFWDSEVEGESIMFYRCTYDIIIKII